jgi:hypothetical protein
MAGSVNEIILRSRFKNHQIGSNEFVEKRIKKQLICRTHTVRNAQ